MNDISMILVARNNDVFQFVDAVQSAIWAEK